MESFKRLLKVNRKSKLKQIEIVFENCEVCYIDAKDIEKVAVKDFDQLMYFSNKSKLSMFSNCTLEVLELNKEALKTNHSYMGDYYNEKETLYERIKHPDIVSIGFYFNNVNGVVSYYLPWNEEDDYYNHYEKIEETDDSIIITIKPDKKDDEK